MHAFMHAGNARHVGYIASYVTSCIYNIMETCSVQPDITVHALIAAGEDYTQGYI